MSVNKSNILTRRLHTSVSGYRFKQLCRLIDLFFFFLFFYPFCSLDAIQVKTLLLCLPQLHDKMQTRAEEKKNSNLNVLFNQIFNLIQSQLHNERHKSSNSP